MSDTVFEFAGYPFYINKKGLSISKKEQTILKESCGEFYEANSSCTLMSSNIQVLNNPRLKRIKEGFDKMVSYYTSDVLGIGNELYMCHSWMTINNKDCQHTRHSHPNAILSLTHYIEVESGDFVIDIGLPKISDKWNFDWDITKITKYNQNHMYVPIKKHNTIIFPGHIFHGSGINKSTTPRVMLGANYFIKGIVGSNKNVSKINL